MWLNSQRRIRWRWLVRFAGYPDGCSMSHEVIRWCEFRLWPRNGNKFDWRSSSYRFWMVNDDNFASASATCNQQPSRPREVVYSRYQMFSGAECRHTGATHRICLDSKTWDLRNEVAVSFLRNQVMFIDFIWLPDGTKCQMSNVKWTFIERIYEVSNTLE